MLLILASARCFKIGNIVLHNLELCCGEILLCLNLSVVKIQKEASVVSIWLFVRESVLSLKRSGLWEEGRWCGEEGGGVGRRADTSCTPLLSLECIPNDACISIYQQKYSFLLLLW